MAERVRSYVSRFIRDIEDGALLNSVCEKILGMDKYKITDPSTYAAGLTYFANLVMGSKKTQKEIADSMGCSVELLRKEYKGIVRRNKDEIGKLLGIK